MKLHWLDCVFGAQKIKLQRKNEVGFVPIAHCTAEEWSSVSGGLIKVKAAKSNNSDCWEF